MEEVWRSIPGFDNYEASNVGKVRSTLRVETVLSRWGTKMEREFQGRVLSTWLSGSGYQTVALGAKNKTMVHRAVWLAFNGDIPHRMTINHLNGRKTDNRLENLELCTYRQNIQHSLATGLTKKSNRGSALLTAEEIRAIRFFYVRRKGPKGCLHLLAKIFKRDRHSLTMIATGKSYGFIK